MLMTSDEYWVLLDSSRLYNSIGDRKVMSLCRYSDSYLTARKSLLAKDGCIVNRWADIPAYIGQEINIRSEKIKDPTWIVYI